MDSSLDGVILKQNEMSVAEKRELVHELSKDLDSAFEVLTKWSRHELLQILSAEVGQERKYRSKAKIVSILLETISERTLGKEDKIGTNKEKGDSSSPNKQIYKRRRKKSNPIRFVAKVKELKVEEEKEATIVDRVSLLCKGKNIKTGSHVRQMEKNSYQLVLKEDVQENGENSGRGFEYYVKIIRQLECAGHISRYFRQEFVTWYSLRATPYEKEIANAYMDVFKDDGKALAQQLDHSFSLSIARSNFFCRY